MRLNRQGFTLIEIMVGITIFSIVILAGFQALSRVNIGKIKLYTETDIEKQAFYFSEKMFEMIKGAGTIDYEEYFNRRVIGNAPYLSGHSLNPTGFGNYGNGGSIGSSYGSGIYYCLSGSGITNGMNYGGGTMGCWDNNHNSFGIFSTGANAFQRFGEYYYQFIDYNSNKDGDLGDEDSDGNLIGDDDDEYLGVGPFVYQSLVDSKNREMYLINEKNYKRTFFRWNVGYDPKYKNPGTDCNFSIPSNPTGSGCLGTIQFLKLDGKDWGMDHDKSTIDSTQYDGKIDTWVYDERIYGSNQIAGSGSESKWINVFPDYINIKDATFYFFPTKNSKYAWGDSSISTNIAPYVRINMILTPSRKKRGGIKGKVPEIKISTTIALNSF